MSVFTINAFPFRDVGLSELEKRDRKYYIDFNIEGQPVFFQINNVTLTTETALTNYVDVTLNDKFSNAATFFKEMDNFNKVSCFNHCDEWLGKQITMKEIDTAYKSALTGNNRVLRVKIEHNAISTFDYKKNKLDLASLQRGHTMDIIVELAGLKIMKNAFSANLILRQIRKHANSAPKIKIIPSEYLFNHDRCDDESLDSQTDIAPLHVSRPPSSSQKAKDDDDDNDDDNDDDDDNDENDENEDNEEVAEEEEKEEEGEEGEEEEKEDEEGEDEGKEKGEKKETKKDEKTETEVKSTETLKNLMADYFSQNSTTPVPVPPVIKAAAAAPKRIRNKKENEKKEEKKEEERVITASILGSLLSETVAPAPAAPAPKRKRPAASAAKKVVVAAPIAITTQLYKNI